MASAELDQYLTSHKSLDDMQANLALAAPARCAIQDEFPKRILEEIVMIFERHKANARVQVLAGLDRRGADLLLSHRLRCPDIRPSESSSSAGVLKASRGHGDQDAAEAAVGTIPSDCHGF